MAVLSSTSPGQLGKYVLPTVEKFNNAMTNQTSLSRGSGKSVRIKNTPNNINALKEFARIASTASQQKTALALPLEVTDTKLKSVTIGSFDKPNIKYNLGDMAEGVVGAAIAARFIYKNRNITDKNVYGVLRALGAPSNYPGKKGKFVERTFKSANENPKVMDDVKFYLSLADVNISALLDRTNEKLLLPYVRSAVRYANSTNVKKWAKLVYENNRYDSIDVVSDGLGGQKTTKVDVYVKINNVAVDIKVSLKAGDVKQFGQVSGVEFEKQQKLWDTTFGYGSDIKGLEKKYDSLISGGEVPQAVSLVYNSILTKFNKDMRSKNSEDVKRTFAESIKFFATLNEDNVTLLQVGNDVAKLYTFDQIYDAIKGMTLSASITTGKSGLPTLLINDATSGEPLIQYRVKQEFKSNGSPYIRNYVEKQTGLSKIIGEYL